MSSPPTSWETVFHSPDRASCLESRLVLASAGIPSRVDRLDEDWVLLVHADHCDAASAELEEYQRENHGADQQRHAMPVYGGAAAGVWAYAVTILAFAFVSTPWALEDVGAMSAGRVVGGELWRCVTALTLHVDAGHVIANLCFGVVFGLLVGQALGGGVAWLAIVIAGALGNLVNALVQPATHLSIGASTAVFAALGILVTHALMSWRSADRRSRFRPLIGGVLLLAYTGIGGERTDVFAHVAGFAAGLVMGWMVCRLPQAWLSNRNLQRRAGLASLALVAASWLVALAVGGGA